VRRRPPSVPRRPRSPGRGLPAVAAAIVCSRSSTASPRSSSPRSSSSRSSSSSEKSGRPPGHLSWRPAAAGCAGTCPGKPAPSTIASASCRRAASIARARLALTRFLACASHHVIIPLLTMSTPTSRSGSHVLPSHLGSTLSPSSSSSSSASCCAEATSGMASTLAANAFMPLRLSEGSRKRRASSTAISSWRLLSPPPLIAFCWAALACPLGLSPLSLAQRTQSVLKRCSCRSSQAFHCSFSKGNGGQPWCTSNSRQRPSKSSAK